MVSVVIALTMAIYNVMLPWCHAMPAELNWIHAFIAVTKKAMLAMRKKSAYKILRIKTDFHIINTTFDEVYNRSKLRCK